MADALVLTLLLAWLLLPLAALASVVRLPGDAWRRVGRSKVLTAVLVVLTGAIGAAYFFLRIRPEVKEAERAAPPADRRKPDPWADEDDRGWG